jgi:hypothetical protein
MSEQQKGDGRDELRMDPCFGQCGIVDLRTALTQAIAERDTLRARLAEGLEVIENGLPTYETQQIESMSGLEGNGEWVSVESDAWQRLCALLGAEGK